MALPRLGPLVDRLILLIERHIERLGDPAERWTRELRLSHQTTYALSMENQRLERELEQLRAVGLRRCDVPGCRETAMCHVCSSHQVDVPYEVMFPETLPPVCHEWTLTYQGVTASEYEIHTCTRCGIQRHSEWGTVPTYYPNSSLSSKGMREEPPCQI